MKTVLVTALVALCALPGPAEARRHRGHRYTLGTALDCIQTRDGRVCSVSDPGVVGEFLDLDLFTSFRWTDGKPAP